MRQVEKTNLTRYGLAKFAVLAFLQWYGKEMSEDVPVEDQVKRFFDWYGREMRQDIQLFKRKS